MAKFPVTQQDRRAALLTNVLSRRALSLTGLVHPGAVLRDQKIVP